MACFKELYLSFDKASLYLKEAGVTPYEINRLEFQIVSGALRIPLAIYRFSDLQALAQRYSRPDALPSIERFITKSQRSRHIPKQDRSQSERKESIRIDSPPPQHVTGRLSRADFLAICRQEQLEDGDLDVV